jgi:hypothetical protein
MQLTTLLAGLGYMVGALGLIVALTGNAEKLAMTRTVLVAEGLGLIWFAYFITKISDDSGASLPFLLPWLGILTCLVVIVVRRRREGRARKSELH